MGEVYEAEDCELRETVAIKTVRAEIARDPRAVERFRREVHLARKVTHPNVCRIFDVFRHRRSSEDGDVTFLSMELLVGESLAHLLHRRGRFSPTEALSIVGQVVAGLSAAHRSGVVHRDFKSGNVFLVPSGADSRAVITDFGLARAPTRGEGRDMFITTTGEISGSPAYMAPEQIQGGDVVPATDIYALGVVMYEMVTGVLPFIAETPWLTALKRLHEAPVSPRAHVPDLEPRWEATILRCLERSPADRFPSVDEVFKALAGPEIPPTIPLPSPHRTPGTQPLGSHRTRIGLALAAVAGVAAAGLWLAYRERPTKAEAPAKRSAAVAVAAEPTSIAVLPFVNMSSDPDQEYFSDGLSEELLNVLSKVPQLRVISRTSSFQFKGKNEDIRTIAGKLNVAHVLEGSVRKSGRRIRITAQLVEAATGSHLWSNTYDRYVNDIFAVQDDIARSVAKASSATLLGLEGKPLPSYGSNADAYNFFLQAKYFAVRGTREGLQKATEFYEKALKLDPGRAAYWSGLAAVHIRQVNHGFLPEAEGFTQSRAEVTKALELDPDLAEAHALLGWIRLTHDWDWEGASASMKKALEHGPGSARVVGNAASLAAALGHLDEAIELYRRAIRLDPLNIAPHFNLSQAASDVGRLDEAEAALRRVLELNPDQPGAHAAVGRLFLLREKPEAAFDEIQKETLPSDRRQGLALAYRALGRKKEAEAALAELVQKDGESSALWIAEVYADRRDSDKAFEWLERAYAQHDPELAFVKSNRLLRNLEGDPRYRAFLQKMRLPV